MSGKPGGYVGQAVLESGRAISESVTGFVLLSFRASIALNDVVSMNPEVEFERTLKPQKKSGTNHKQKATLEEQFKMKKQIVMIVTAVSCMTSFVSPALAEHKSGGHHSGSGNHATSASGHAGHSSGSKGGKSGGKHGGSSSDSISSIIEIVRDVVDR